MSHLSFRCVFLLVIKLVIISEIVCFPGHLLQNNLFSNSLHYVSQHLNLIQPQFSLRKLLTPKNYAQNNIYPRPSEGRYNVLQQIPTPASFTETNIEEFNSSLSTESSNKNFTKTANPKIEDKDIDEKWNSFFNEYFKNQSFESDKKLKTTDNINNGDVFKPLKNIYDGKNIENIETTNDLFTDTTDTTLFDNETTTDDDLLRNGVPPELLSSLLG